MDISWDALSETERRLVEATTRGDIAELGPRDAEHKPKVRASLIRALLLGMPSGQDGDRCYAVQASGVRMRGAHIDGVLNLRGCRGVGSMGLPTLALLDCDAPDRMDLRDARISRLSFERSRMGEMVCTAAHISGPFNFSYVTPYNADPDGPGAWITAAGATIEGEVNGSGAKLVTRQRGDASKPWSRWYALRLSDARIEGTINLGDNFEAHGGVTISGARIEGDVWLRGSRLIARESRAFNARSSRIGGLMIMIDGCWAIGEVSFVDAIIEGRLSCNEGVREAAPADAAVTHGKKERAFVRIDGMLDLRGADFRASVELGGGLFDNPNGWAINAAGVRIAGDFRIRPDNEHLDEPTYIRGGLRLEGAQIGGEVMWEKLLLEGPGPSSVAHINPANHRKRRKLAQDAAAAPRIMMADARIGRALKALSLEVEPATPRSRVDAVIDLTGVKCAALDDDLDRGWGQKGARVWLLLEGFVYDRLEEDVKFQGPRGGNSDRWGKRRQWLKRTFEAFGTFHPQPYYQLADFYARTGWITDMHRCLEHEQWRHMRQESGGWIGALLKRPLQFLFGLTAGFGHNSMSLTLTLLLYLIVGAAGAHALNTTGRLVIDTTYLAQQNQTALANGEVEIRCGDEIDPLVYALDVMVPLTDLRQEVQCEPGFVDPRDGSEFELFLLRMGKALYALFGALLTGAAVLTLTGVLRRRLER